MYIDGPDDEREPVTRLIIIICNINIGVGCTQLQFVCWVVCLYMYMYNNIGWCSGYGCGLPILGFGVQGGSSPPLSPLSFFCL